MKDTLNITIDTSGGNIKIAMHGEITCSKFGKITMVASIANGLGLEPNDMLYSALAMKGVSGTGVSIRVPEHPEEEEE